MLLIFRQRDPLRLAPLGTLSAAILWTPKCDEQKSPCVV
jgi:hypothetical protein